MKILKVQTATNLREKLFDTLHDVATGEAQLVTHRNGDEVVLISREAMNGILTENEVLKAIAKGRSEIADGKGIANADVKTRLQAKMKKWRK